MDPMTGALSQSARTIALDQPIRLNLMVRA